MLDDTAPRIEALTKAQPAQDHIVRVSVADMALYESWEDLPTKRGAKRISKLVRRGLPIPSEDGFICISMTTSKQSYIVISTFKMHLCRSLSPGSYTGSCQKSGANLGIKAVEPEPDLLLFIG